VNRESRLKVIEGHSKSMSLSIAIISTQYRNHWLEWWHWSSNL